MAISTQAGVLAGLQRPQSFVKTGLNPTNNVYPAKVTSWAQGGNPVAGSYDNTLNGLALSAPITGQIPFLNPGSGNSYLAGLQLNNGPNVPLAGRSLMLCDRLWHNGGFTITSTSPQAITSPTFPARDVNGSTNGDGVLLALEVSSSVGAAAPSISVVYTNQAGVGSKIANNINPTFNNAGAGSVFLLGLEPGDTGVRSVQSLTLSASWISGVINLVAYRLLAMAEMKGSGIQSSIDAITGGFPRLYDDTVPYFMVENYSSSTSHNIAGKMIVTQG